MAATIQVEIVSAEEEIFSGELLKWSWLLLS